MDLANEAEKNCDFATNVSGCFHFVKKKLISVPKIEIDWRTTRNHIAKDRFIPIPAKLVWKIKDSMKERKA